MITVNNRCPPTVAQVESAHELLRTRLLISIGKTAELLGVCKETIYRRIKSGLLKGSSKSGKTTHVTTASIIAYLDE